MSTRWLRTWFSQIYVTKAHGKTKGPVDALARACQELVSDANFDDETFCSGLSLEDVAVDAMER